MNFKYEDKFILVSIIKVEEFFHIEVFNKLLDITVRDSLHQMALLEPEAIARMMIGDSFEIKIANINKEFMSKAQQYKSQPKLTIVKESDD